MTTVLVADDDPAVRSIIGDALRLDGYDVETVCNGRQALTALGQRPRDALILDLEMPVLDGSALVQCLRARRRCRHVPFVVVSACPDLAATGVKLGASACFAKPFDLGLLLAAIEDMAPPA